MFTKTRDNIKFISLALFIITILVGVMFVNFRTVFAVGTTVTVTDQTTLIEALANVDVGTILIGNNIHVTEKINITRPVTIDGTNRSISMTGNDPVVWNSPSAYVFQVYGTTGVIIKDIKLTSGNAGLLINGSTATLAGTIDVSGNGFGGIESSGSTLTVSGATLVNTTEDYALPTLWEDGTTGTTVIGFTGTKNTTIKPSQVQYYLIAGHSYKTSIVTDQTTLLEALADVNVGIITFGNSFSVNQQINITRSVTIDGAGKIITASFAKTDNSNNSVIGVQHSDVTIKNLIEDGTGSTNLHGINIYLSNNVSLDNVTVSNNSNAGMIVNGSTVTVNDITTLNNGWGGINVDQGSGVTAITTLTVNGTSTHTESNAAIWRDDNLKTNVTVVDTNYQYTSSTYVHDTSIEGTNYILDIIAPVITIDSYITTPTNQDITVTASTDEGTLNASSHIFTENDSFDFVATDKAGNETTKTVTITNIDKEAPVITVTGTNPISVLLGSSYTDAGATATDNFDTEVIVGSSDFDTNTVGTFTITYTATDEAGNIATLATREVTVYRRGSSGSRATPAVPATPAIPGVSPAIPATPAVPAGRVLGAESFNFTKLMKRGSDGVEVMEL